MAVASGGVDPRRPDRRDQPGGSLHSTARRSSAVCFTRQQEDWCMLSGQNIPGADTSDVVVIGGGPAGSTVSTLLAQQGYRVQLFEREHFPRFHIGESLIPETYWVLKRLNMLDKMKQSHFVKKYSVQFVNQHGKLSEPFYFMDHKPHECSQTWQVAREEFDQMLLENARQHGVMVHEGVRV